MKTEFSKASLRTPWDDIASEILEIKLFPEGPEDNLFLSKLRKLTKERNFLVTMGPVIKSAKDPHSKLPATEMWTRVRFLTPTNL